MGELTGETQPRSPVHPVKAMEEPRRSKQAQLPQRDRPANWSGKEKNTQDIQRRTSSDRSANIQSSPTWSLPGVQRDVPASPGWITKRANEPDKASSALITLGFLAVNVSEQEKALRAATMKDVLSQRKFCRDRPQVSDAEAAIINPTVLFRMLIFYHDASDGIHV